MKFENKENEFDFYWNKIFDGLSWNPIEFNTYRFDESLSLPAKFNKLYEMFKQLALNNQQVMDYLKEFVENFDTNLYNTVYDILNEWVENEYLSEMIRKLINEEVVEARGGETRLNVRLLNIEESIESVGDGSPKDYFTSIKDLEETYPNGTDGIFIVFDNSFEDDNGHIFMWKNNKWNDLGVYQTRELEDNSATSKKRTNLGETGYIAGNEPFIVDFNESKIYFSIGDNINRVYNRENKYDLPTIELNFDENLTGNGISTDVRLLRLVYRTRTNELLFISHNHPEYFNEFDVDLGYIIRDLDNNNEYNAHLNGNYTTINHFTPHHLPLINTATPINFDTINREMVITNPTLISVGTIGYNLNNQPTINVPFYEVENTTSKIIFNPKERKFYSVFYSDSYNSDHILIASIRESENNLDVSINGRYTIDGLEPYRSRNILYVGDSPITLNILERTITFPSADNGKARLFIENRVYELDETNSTILIPSFEEIGNLIKIIFNETTKTFRCVQWSVTDIAYNEVLFAIVRLTPSYTMQVNGNYEIEGNSTNESSDLHVLTHNFEDSIYSWWTYPLAKRYKGIKDKTYFSYTDSIGYSGVVSLDNITGEIVKKRLKKSDIDDHNAIAIDIMNNGKILAAYSGGHNTDNYINIRISSRKESIVDFDNETLINVGEPTTYSQLFNIDDKWFLFFRMNNNNWGFTSSNDGKVWTNVVKILTSTIQYYVKFTKVSDNDHLLRMVTTSNPNASDRNFRLCFFNTSTLNIEKDDGTVIGTQVDKDEIPIVVSVATNYNQRLLDVAETPKDLTRIVYGVFQINDINGEYRVIDVGTDYNILTNTGRPFYVPSHYFNGAIFKDESTIVLSEGISGSDNVKKFNLNDNEWNESESLYENTLAIRPTKIINDDKIVIQTGYYNEYNFTDFLTDFTMVDD